MTDAEDLAGDGGNYFKDIRMKHLNFRIKGILFFEMCDDCFEAVMKFAEKKG